MRSNQALPIIIVLRQSASPWQDRLGSIKRSGGLNVNQFKKCAAGALVRRCFASS